MSVWLFDEGQLQQALTAYIARHVQAGDLLQDASGDVHELLVDFMNSPEADVLRVPKLQLGRLAGGNPNSVIR